MLQDGCQLMAGQMLAVNKFRSFIAIRVDSVALTLVK